MYFFKLIEFIYVVYFTGFWMLKRGQDNDDHIWRSLRERVVRVFSFNQQADEVAEIYEDC
jgi:hypothetical protein